MDDEELTQQKEEEMKLQQENEVLESQLEQMQAELNKLNEIEDE